MLPIELALAQPVPEVPTGPNLSYEAKLDGWRGVAIARPRALLSRTGTPLAERFPEVVAAVADLGDVTLDGELVAVHHGRLEFAALQSGPRRRLHDGITVLFMAFDVLMRDGVDLRTQPYRQRRAELVALTERRTAGLVQAVPATTDCAEAMQWMAPEWGEAGVEGVVTKPMAGPYRAGRRSGWRKTRALITTEAAVLGVTRTAVVLGLPTRTGRWRAVGLSQPVSTDLAADLARMLQADGDLARLPGVLTGLPGNSDTTYQPTRITTVVELVVDQAVEFGRWRHRPRIVRMRHDLRPDDLPSRLAQSRIVADV